MDLRQLAALVAIADHGTFSAAAKALFTVQSNVSAHVARLEKELGTPLVDRATGKLTAEGDLVVSRARRVQGELSALSADIASSGAEVRGDARLGSIGTTARWLSPLVLERLHSEHPGVRAILVEGPTTSLVPRLLDGQLDLAIIHLPADDPELDVEPLFAEDLVVVAPHGHPLAERGAADVRELAEHALILPAPGTSLRDDLDEMAGFAGVEFRAIAEIDGVRLMASLAFELFGPAILPATAISTWRDTRPLSQGWRIVDVPGLPRRHVGLATRRRGLLSAPARALARIVVSVVSDSGDRQPGLRSITATT